MKTKAIAITLDRWEGPTDLCGKREVESPDVWAKADRILFEWRMTAPGPGKGYNKVGFVVRYEDGETYSGRYDLKKHETPDLAGHIRAFCRFASSDRAEWVPLEGRQQFAAFLERYEVGSED